MRRTLTALAAITLTFSLAACGGSDEPSPEVTVTESAPYSGDSLAEPEPAEDTTTTDDGSISALAMEMAWEDMPQSERDGICDGWAIDKSMMTDVFMEGVDDMDISRADVITFFDGKCL